jgi:DNA ligase 1
VVEYSSKNIEEIMSIKLAVFALLVTTLLAFEVQKPKVYHNQEVTNWYMSEKLDGIRGYWNGKSFYTKNGNRLYPPKWFTNNFPPFALDGELWSKRADFENIQNIVLDKTPSSSWSQITYNIFEVPYTKGDFLQRLAKAQKWFETHPNKSVKIISQIKIKSTVHLEQFLDKIVSQKGEGVIVKEVSQPYHTGRSRWVYKVKKAYDMEGVVIGYNWRTDGYTLKSLRVKLASGVVFNLGGGLDDHERKLPPKIGESITFKYFGFTKNGKPKFASYMRIRKKE